MALVIALAMVLTMMSMSAFAAFEYTLATEFVEGTTYYDEDHNPVEIEDATAFDDYLTNTGNLYTRSGQEDEGGEEGGGEGQTTTKKTITLTGGKAGHTYTLYQIFTGTVEDVNGTTMLTNIQWGDDANAAFKALYPTAAAAALAIHEENDARATAQRLVGNNPSAPTYLEGGQANPLTADGNVVFEDLEEGYYVIVDVNGNQDVTEDDYTSAYIVEVVEDVTGAIKGSGATSDKAVLDPETGASATDDAAAYNIGDAIPFTLTATTADNVAAYKKYHITFQDKQSAGLDAPTSFKVNVLGHTFDLTPDNTSGIYWQYTDDPEANARVHVYSATPEDGYSFAITVEFSMFSEDLYLLPAFNSENITVEYTSTLNANAVIGIDTPGNTNDMHITYSNNPEDKDGGDEGKTPEDTVKVFTYKTVIDKVDGDGKALEGAGFTIYQEVEGTTTGEGEGATTTYPAGAVKGSDITFAEGVEHSKIEADKYYVVKQMTTVSGNNAQFEFKGLADGVYVLVETTVPTGFNAFNSVVFAIDSTVTEEEGIYELTGQTPFDTTNAGADGAVEADKADGTKHALDSGELFAEIENNSGQELPETGGIGTTIFYVVGALLVIGAGVILITRRRMDA